MNNIKCAIPFLALALLLPIGLADAQISNELIDEEKPYTIEEIEHAFAVMEEYVIYDESKNITFDTINATTNLDVTQLDIDVALDFAVHNNDIMNAAIGPTGTVDETQIRDNEQLKQTLQDLKDGKFRALFGNEIWEMASVSEITFTSWDYTEFQTISAFGVSEYVMEPVSHGGTQTPIPNSLTACGPYGIINPHPEPDVEKTGWFGTKAHAINAIDASCHLVPFMYSGNHGLDFSKKANAYGCNNGEFRSQIVVTYVNSWWRHYSQSPEPNPELLTYDWPASWWGPYVLSWHIAY